MRNFFEHQDRAQRRTSLLLVCMSLAVLAMGSTLFGFVWLARSLLLLRVPPNAVLPPALQLGHLYMWCVLGTAAAVAAASILRIWSLRDGGRSVAHMLDARLVSGQARDDLERRLLNVVTEMALAAGVPVPQVYVLDGERSINALAAGWELEDAIICTTRGCLEKLTRAELSGVVAHEFSHILHGDARLNLRLMGTVYGMLSIGLLGQQLMRAGRLGQKNGLFLVLFGFMIATVGAVGGVLGKLVKAAVSRQREFLADAAAVQFTRDPSGIAGALKKIGGYGFGARVDGVAAAEASHFFFGEVGRAFDDLAWFSTHPPLNQRITRIEPSFDGAFVTPPEGIAEPSEPGPRLARGERRVSAHAEPERALAAQLMAARTANTNAPVLGSSAPEAAEKLGRLPERLRQSCESSFSACGLVFAMLCQSESTPPRTRAQLECIRQLAGGALARETEQLLPLIWNTSRPDRLALATLAAPALRALESSHKRMLQRTVAALIAEDGATSVFEHVLGYVLAAHWSGTEPRTPSRRNSTLAAHVSEVQLVLSALSHTGAAFADSAGAAFAAGVRRLPGLPLALLPASPRLLSGLAPALDSLRALRPIACEALVDACAHAVLADQRVTEDEITLLRAVCLALGVPLPRLDLSQASGGVSSAH